MSKFSFMRKALPLVLAIAAFGTPAVARDWRPSAQSESMNYSQIIDSKDKNIVFVWWLVPSSFNEPSLTPILQKYVIIGVAHAKMDETIDISFLDVDTPAVKDGKGNVLKVVKDDDQPPGVVTILAAMRSVLVKMIGPMGKGMKLFVYEPNGVDACKPGKLSVPIDGETYTYDTPMPGCPKP